MKNNNNIIHLNNEQNQGVVKYPFELQQKVVSELYGEGKVIWFYKDVALGWVITVEFENFPAQFVSRVLKPV
jgi:hypothetical protein